MPSHGAPSCLRSHHDGHTSLIDRSEVNQVQQIPPSPPLSLPHTSLRSRSHTYNPKEKFSRPMIRSQVAPKWLQEALIRTHCKCSVSMSRTYPTSKLFYKIDMWWTSMRVRKVFRPPRDKKQSRREGDGFNACILAGRSFRLRQCLRKRHLQYQRHCTP